MEVKGWVTLCSSLRISIGMIVSSIPSSTVVRRTLKVSESANFNRGERPRAHDIRTPKHGCNEQGLGTSNRCILGELLTSLGAGKPVVGVKNQFHFEVFHLEL